MGAMPPCYLSELKKMLVAIHSGVPVPVAQVSTAKAVSKAKPVKVEPKPLVYSAKTSKSVPVEKSGAVKPGDVPDFEQSYTLTYQSHHPDVLFIGGGNMVYWRHRILTVFPDAIVDARVNRPFVNFTDVYKKLSDYKAVKSINTIVISWDSMDNFTDGALSTLLAEIPEKTVYLVPNSKDEKQVYAFFKIFHGIYPQVYLINFSSLAYRNPEYYQTYGKLSKIKVLSSVGINSWLSFLKYNMEQDYFSRVSATKSKYIPAVDSTKSHKINHGATLN